MEELMRQEMRQQMALSIQCAYRQHMAKIAHIEAIEQRATLDARCDGAVSHLARQHAH